MYVKFVCVKLLYVKCACVREAAGGGGGTRDTESKTRTPHKVVGKNVPNHQSEYFVYLEIYEYYMTCSFLIIHVNQGRNPNSDASCLLPRRFDIITLCMACHQLQCLSLTVLLRMTDYPSWKIPHAEQQDAPLFGHRFTGHDAPARHGKCG